MQSLHPQQPPAEEVAVAVGHFAFCLSIGCGSTQLWEYTFGRASQQSTMRIRRVRLQVRSPRSPVVQPDRQTCIHSHDSFCFRAEHSILSAAVRRTRSVFSPHDVKITSGEMIK